MESSEEKLHNMIMKERINEAKEKAQQFAKEQDQINRKTGGSKGSDFKDEIAKKDFGKEEIVHHNVDMNVFKKDEPDDNLQ